MTIIKLIFLVPLVFLTPQGQPLFLRVLLITVLIRSPLTTLIVFPEVDFLSVSLIVLTVWLSIFMHAANFGAPRNKLLLLAVKLLVLFLLLRFFAPSILMYYVFFEASLIPIF